MSINSNKTYNSIVFLVDDQVAWTIPGPLSGDLVAGLLAGFENSLDYITTEGYLTEQREHKFIIKSADGDIIYIHGVYGSFSDVMSNYILMEQTNINAYYNTKIPANKMAWWIDNVATKNTFYLFLFATNKFVQGFISAYKAFHLDFRDFIKGHPFSTDNRGDKFLYNVEGYDIQKYQPIERIPAQMGAFYTGSFEENATDYD